MNYYPFHVGDYAAHTGHLDLLEDLAYRRLLDAYYLAEGPLPVDMSECARRVRMRGHESVVEVVLCEFFVLTEEGWRHKRCDAEIGRKQAKADKASNSAAMRWQKGANANAMRTHSERNANAMRTGCEGNAPNSQEPIAKNQEPKKDRESASDDAALSRGARIPESFPDAEAREWCRGERPELDPDALAAKFRDYWAGVPGAKGRKADWPATWRNFVRSERRPMPRASPPGTAPVSRAAAFMASLRSPLQADPTEVIDVCSTVVPAAARRLGS